MNDSSDSPRDDEWDFDDVEREKTQFKRTFEPWGPAESLAGVRSESLIQDGTVRFFNIIALGAAGVGKTTLLAHFAYRQVFASRTTVAVDYTKVSMYIHQKEPKGLRGTRVPVVLSLVDSPGDTAFNNFTDRILARAHACLLVFDASDRSSLDALGDVVKRVKRQCPRAPRALVANKMDKYITLDADQRWMNGETIASTMLEFGCKAFYPLCAKADLLAIDEMMILHTEAANSYARRLRREAFRRDDIVQLEQPRSPRYFEQQPSVQRRAASGKCAC